MGFEFQNKMEILKQTTEKGQLLSVSDSTAQHTVGTQYYDRKNNKTYVYAYNALGATFSVNDLNFLVPQHTGGTGGNYTVEPLGDCVTKAVYVCVPAAEVPTLYYGWAQVQGDVDVNASDTSFFGDEAWAVNDELYISAAKAETVADGDVGVTVAAFAIVEDSRASDGTAECTIYLIGREAVGDSS